MIIELLSDDVLEFLEGIEALGFSLCAVGGLPRDFFYSKTIGSDFDFEIRPLISLEETKHAWPVYYKKLHHYLDQKKIPFTELPYLITRVNFSGIDFEFSSPRIEKNLLDNFTHHHFEAVLDPLLSYDISFRRRDFTINAIGIEFQFSQKKEFMVDPYLGMTDLTNGILRAVSDDFFLDAVRFLRLVRFQLKFNQFTIDEKIKLNLTKFNLTKLSNHHFQEELNKASAYCDQSLAPFLNLFKKIVLSYNLELSEDFLIWTHYQFPDFLKNKESLLAFIFMQNEVEAEKVSQFFSMPQKKLSDLRSFYKSYNVIKNLKESDISSLLKMPSEEALAHEILKDLKNLEEKKSWGDLLKSINLIETPLILDWSDWEKVEVSTEELNAIKPIFRSYFLFYKTLKKKFSNG